VVVFDGHTMVGAELFSHLFTVLFSATVNDTGFALESHDKVVKIINDSFMVLFGHFISGEKV
jgi:hypothetical protein